jgi:hypothetical protein
MTADASFQAGFSVVVQDVVLGASLSTYVDMIGSRPLVVVALVPRPDVVAQREAGRSKMAYRDGHFGIAELDDGLRSATPRIGLWLDTSDQTPERTVDEIVARGLDEGQVA